MALGNGTTSIVWQRTIEVGAPKRALLGAPTSIVKAARKDKRTWVENLAQAAQNAADLKNSCDLYRITRQLAKKSSTNAISQVRGKDGKQLTTVEQVQRWQEHFGEILSAPVHEHEHPLAINENHPKAHRNSQSHKTIKKKAAGPDGIPPKVFMACPNTMTTLVEPLIKITWELEHFPDEWKNGYIIKLPKKGNLSDCKNWRGITLLNTINKLVTTILYQQLIEKL